MPNADTEMSSRRRQLRAFSLIETVAAISIMAFALVSLVGLIPIGLASFQNAMDTSLNSQIVQQVAAAIQQADFNGLSQQPSVLRFDDQAERLDAGDDGSRAYYYVNIVPKFPADLPGGQSANLAMVLVEIVRNPSGKTLDRDASGAVLTKPGQTVTRHPLFVSSQNN